MAVAELMVHKRRAKKFYNKIAEITALCEKNPEVGGFTFDYMQNLPLPNIPVQEIFYFRQLWLYLFEIHNLKDNSGYFYSYHEGHAKKGPNEICTFLIDYISNHVSPEVKELHIFSDGCPGQNRNHTVVRFLLTLQATKRFRKIHHYFPIRGHSFLPCDRDFGTLKRLVRKHDRIYIPEEYEEMILKCRTKKPFNFKNINHKDIIDYKTWWPQFYKKSSKSLTSDESFTISKYFEFIYNSELPGHVITRNFIDGAFNHTFNLLKPSIHLSLPDKQAYSKVIPLNIKKINDLKNILRYITGEDLEFFYHITSWTTCNKDDADDDEDQ